MNILDTIKKNFVSFIETPEILPGKYTTFLEPQQTKNGQIISLAHITKGALYSETYAKEVAYAIKKIGDEGKIVSLVATSSFHPTGNMFTDTLITAVLEGPKK